MLSSSLALILRLTPKNPTLDTLSELGQGSRAQKTFHFAARSAHTCQPPFHAHNLRDSLLHHRRARRSRPLRFALLLHPATVRSSWSALRQRTCSSCVTAAQRGHVRLQQIVRHASQQHGFPFVSSCHGRQPVAPRCCLSICNRRRPSVAGINDSMISSAQPSPPWSGSRMLALGHGRKKIRYIKKFEDHR
jgi:hypothetical protein